MKFAFLCCIYLFSNYIFAQSKQQINYMAQNWLAFHFDQYKIQNVSIRVLEDQNTLFDFFTKNANENTNYRVCSISKLFTSIGIMQLIEQNKLKLDDDIDFSFIQSFPNQGKISIMSLLTHSSGLPRDFGEFEDSIFTPPFKEYSEKQLFDLLKRDKTYFSPHQGNFLYSNIGMSLLGKILSSKTKMTWFEYIQKNILKPLKMNNTTDQQVNSTNYGHGPLTDENTREIIPMHNMPTLIQPAGGLSSNIHDLTLFAKWHLNNNNLILKPSTLNYMMQTHLNERGLGYAKIILDDQTELTGHGGVCFGFRSLFYFDPSTTRYYIILTNAIDTKNLFLLNSLKKIFDFPYKKIKHTNNSKQLNMAGLYSAHPVYSETLILPWNNSIALLQLASENPAKDLVIFENLKDNTIEFKYEKNKIIGFIYKSIFYRKIK